MSTDAQLDLLCPVSDLGFARFLLADLHDDLVGKVTRFRHLSDLSMSLGSSGTMLPGGETTWAAWTEARTSFIHGNFVATVLLSQGLAEHILAAHLALGLDAEELPERITFHETLKRCLARNVICEADADDLRHLMGLRNPLSHYRSIDDSSNLSRRALNEKVHAAEHLRRDASFAISMAVRLLSLPAFRLGE